MNPVPRKGHGYTGTHTPLPDGLCRHRWANRLTRVVGGCPVAALATYRAGLRERVAGLEDVTTDRRPGDDADCDDFGCEDETHPVHRVTDFRAAVLALIDDTR